MNELYPFQRAGVDFLTRHKRAYLADEMGLGKTVQAIVAAAKVNARRIIVVCPASVKENWRREFKEWWPLPRQMPYELTIVSYAALIRRQSQFALDRDAQILGRPNLVILDEAHYCKTPSSQRTKAALRLAQDADRAWLLSGTPMPNDPRELYPVFKVLWPDLVPPKNAYEWMDRYCQWSSSDYGYRVWGTTPLAKTELVPAWKTISMRRKLKDIRLDLPPLRTTVQYLPRDPKLADELVRLGVEPESEEHMSTLRRVLGSYKAPKIAKEILRELEDKQYESIVVLYHHHDTGRVLFEAFHKEHATYGFDGSTPSTVRQQQIDGFQETGGIFLAQQTAAGIGITLTRASEIVLVEPSWSPEDNNQAIKRVHRIGQDAPCRARLFAVPESLDEALMGTLYRKTQIIQEVVDGEETKPD